MDDTKKFEREMNDFLRNLDETFLPLIELFETMSSTVRNPLEYEDSSWNQMGDVLTKRALSLPIPDVSSVLLIQTQMAADISLYWRKSKNKMRVPFSEGLSEIFFDYKERINDIKFDILSKMLAKKVKKEYPTVSQLGVYSGDDPIQIFLWEVYTRIGSLISSMVDSFKIQKKLKNPPDEIHESGEHKWMVYFDYTRQHILRAVPSFDGMSKLNFYLDELKEITMEELQTIRQPDLIKKYNTFYNRFVSKMITDFIEFVIDDYYKD